MDFIFEDIDDLSEDKLLDLIRYNVRIATLKRNDLKQLQTATSSSKIDVTIPQQVVYLDEEVREKKEREESFEKEVEYYIREFKKLKGDYSKKNLDSVLPSTDNEYYELIIKRIIGEVLRDLKDINEIIMSEEAAMSKEDLAEYKKEIARLLSVKSLLKKRIEKTDNVPTKKQNRLVFVQMGTGKLRVEDEIKDVPAERYELFSILFDSIKDGTFKNVSNFTMPNLPLAFSEVRKDQARVVFDKISMDCYAVISIFIKKNQNEKGYREALYRKIQEYLVMKPYIVEKLNDPEFVKQITNDELRILDIFKKNKDDNKGGTK